MNFTEILNKMECAKRNRQKACDLLTAALWKLRKVTEDTQSDRSSYQDCLRELQETSEAWEQAQTEVESQTETDIELQQEMEDAMVLYKEVCSLRRAAKRNLEKLNKDQNRSSVRKTSSECILPSMSQLKQPKLKLWKFNGTPAEWPSWWETFKQVIDDNDIPAQSKMLYLKSFVDGDAEIAIKGFALTEDHYQEAKKVLEEKYGRQGDLVSTSNLEGSSHDVSVVHQKSDIVILHENLQSCSNTHSKDSEICHHSCEWSPKNWELEDEKFDGFTELQQELSKNSENVSVCESAYTNLQDAVTEKQNSADFDLQQNHLLKSDIRSDVEIIESRTVAAENPVIENKSAWSTMSHQSNEINLIGHQVKDGNLIEQDSLNQMSVKMETNLNQFQISTESEEEIVGDKRKFGQHVPKVKKRRKTELSESLVDLGQEGKTSFCKNHKKRDTVELQVKYTVPDEQQKVDNGSEDISQSVWFVWMTMTQIAKAGVENEIQQTNRWFITSSDCNCSMDIELMRNFKRTRKK